MRANPAFLVGLGATALLACRLAAVGPVVLPPFLVEEPETSVGQHWIHGEDARFEVLSACDPDETSNFVQQLRRRLKELDRVVPGELLAPTKVPITLILYPGSQRRSISDELLRVMFHSEQVRPSRGLFRPLEDLRLSDADSTAIFVFLDDWAWANYRGQPNKVVFSPIYLRFLLQSRAPALPDWYVSGVAGLYESYASSTVDYLWGGNDGPLLNRFHPDPWASEASARALAAHPEAPRAMIPLQELFAPVEPTGKSEAYQAAWAAEAELFVRWALSPKVKDGRGKMQRFVESSVLAPPSEPAFQAAFGLDYADAFEELSDYLPTAVRESLDLGFTPAPEERPMKLDEASVEDVRRIKGDWSRRTLRVIRQNDPQMLPPFVEETKHLLQGAYDRGDRDPRLIADLALFRIDLGDQAGAAALLGSSYETSIARPIGAVELALWRLDQAIAHPAGEGGALSQEQADGVANIVDRARKLQPPIESTYQIAARLVQHSGHEPTEEDRVRLNEGARLFPRDPALLMKTAAWDLRAGDFSTALQLADLGIAESNDAAIHAKLATLRELAIKMPSAPNPAPGG